MSARAQHPMRETKIRQWVNSQDIGQTFRASDVAKSLNLTPVEVGNILKVIDNVKMGAQRPRAVWTREGP